MIIRATIPVVTFKQLIDGTNVWNHSKSTIELKMECRNDVVKSAKMMMSWKPVLVKPVRTLRLALAISTRIEPVKSRSQTCRHHQPLRSYYLCLCISISHTSMTIRVDSLVIMRLELHENPIVKQHQEFLVLLERLDPYVI